jgi:hypothetical protein
MKKLPLVVSHDAGASELISSYILKKGFHVRYALKGPAIKIFEKRLGRLELVGVENGLENSEYLLAGTGWSSNFEISAIKLAKDRGIKVVAFLDHWANFAQRFYLHEQCVLPDEIWVADTEAKFIADSVFSGIPVVLKENFYFQEILKEFEGVQKKIDESNQVLFISQAIAEMNNKLIAATKCFDQYDAFNFLVRNLHSFKDVSKIIIRPHPSENFDLNKIKPKNLNILVEVDGETSLINQLAKSKIVFGINSTALALSAKIGKRTISCIPDKMDIFELPHKNIERISMLVGNLKK